MKTSKDRFSLNSSLYLQYRPTYPKTLYEEIYRHCKSFEKVWDCGTGNGQAAVVLSQKFKDVFATDLSEQQLQLAPKKNNIYYSKQVAESTNFQPNCFDLVCVAQDVHWFNIQEFNKEVRRVLKKDGVFAIWGYDLVRINPNVNKVVDDFYYNVVGSYWDAERKSIELHYQDLNFPFEELPINDSYEFVDSLKLDHFLGYINSWSAVKNYQIAHETNPV